jgi:hypothetical protein
MCTPGRLLMPEIMVKWLFPFDFLKSMLPNLLRKSLCCHVNAWVLLFSRLVDADIFFQLISGFIIIHQDLRYSMVNNPHPGLVLMRGWPGPCSLRIFANHNAFCYAR